LIARRMRPIEIRKLVHRLIASGPYINAGSTLWAHFRLLGPSRWGNSIVKLGIVLVALAGLLAASPARAETHIFLVDSSDGYGVDRCLASGEPCGAAAASALCRAREYAKAVDFGRIDQAEITGGVPAGTQVSACKGRSCPDMVAITCSR
jgi:hypothetical protein